MVAQVDSPYAKARPTKLISRLISYLFFEGRPLTTRGRWINPFLFAFFYLLKHFPQIKHVTSPTFILGTGRSGTTILGVILSMHRCVGFLNEPKAMWHAIFPNEDLIGSYSMKAARYRLGASDADDEVKRSAHRLFGAYLASVVSRQLVDKYPELIFRLPFVREIFPDAKYLFLVRNGWDTCASIEKWSERLGITTESEIHDWWGVDRRKWNYLVDQLVSEHDDLSPHMDDMRTWTRQSDMAAVEWIVTMREGLRQLELNPGSMLRVNYEELCANPESELARITGFMGLADDETFVQYAVETLNAAPAKPPLDLHPAILEPFLKTMKDLGYEYD